MFCKYTAKEHKTAYTLQLNATEWNTNIKHHILLETTTIGYNWLSGQVMRGPEHRSADYVKEQVTSQSHGWDKRQKFNFMSLVNLTCMSLECWQNPEHLQATDGGTGRTCKPLIPHTYRLLLFSPVCCRFQWSRPTRWTGRNEKGRQTGRWERYTNNALVILKMTMSALSQWKAPVISLEWPQLWIITNSHTNKYVSSKTCDENNLQPQNRTTIDRSNAQM